jgi:2-polyprenyl-3-methyl-5-hydroxy-6-metoxy-1,4-benzoquinol methylase
VKKRREPAVTDVNAEARRIWDANAEWWDDRIGDGNQFQIELIEPATERLLGAVAGETVLDIGCGAGRFARRMAELGASVVAFDFSERFIARAKERTPPETRNIEYHVMDATDGERLLALGEKRFDAAVATMALMDMAAIEPLMGALRELLKSGARFVFSVMHPCFDSSHTCKFAEQVVADGRVTTRRGVMVRGYLTPTASKAEGIVGQPEPQHYFHRPLSMLFNAGFREGFVVDGFEEPAFQTGLDDAAAVWWRHPDIPPVLVVRMRLVTP